MKPLSHYSQLLQFLFIYSLFKSIIFVFGFVFSNNNKHSY